MTNRVLRLFGEADEEVVPKEDIVIRMTGCPNSCGRRAAVMPHHFWKSGSSPVLGSLVTTMHRSLRVMSDG